MNIVGSWDDKAAQKILRQFADKPGNRKKIAATVTASAALVQRYAKIELLTPGNYKRKPDQELRQSIGLVAATPERLFADVGPSAIEGRIREFGGTIRPVHAKMLSWLVPLSQVSTHQDIKWRKRKGKTVATAGALRGSPWRVVAQSVKRSVRRGKVVTRGGELLVRIFARKVEHPAQPYMRPAWRKAHGKIQRLFDDLINRLQGVEITPPEL